MPKISKETLKNLVSQIRQHWFIPALTVLVFIVFISVALIYRPKPAAPSAPVSTGSATLLPSENIALPSPDLRSGNSIEAVLKARRTRRDFVDKEISLKTVSQMLWAAQGVTVDWGGRTTPSAKSTYPLTVYLIASKVTGLDAGEYQYIPGDRTPVHQLKPIKKVDLQQALFTTLNESSFKSAPAVLVVTGNMGKMTEAYGGIPHDKEVYLEAGHAGQNLYLQAESLHQGMVVISSFEEAKVRELITLPASETIIYLVPFGTPVE